jgi:hypothetical protein
MSKRTRNSPSNLFRLVGKIPLDGIGYAATHPGTYFFIRIARVLRPLLPPERFGKPMKIFCTVSVLQNSGINSTVIRGRCHQERKLEKEMVFRLEIKSFGMGIEPRTKFQFEIPI